MLLNNQFSNLILRSWCLFFLLSSASVADELVDSISKRLSNTEIIYGEFQQEKHLKILRKPLLATGIFTYHPNKGVIWKTLTPAPSLLMLNNTRLLTNQGEQAIPAAFARVFQALLGGNLHALINDFTMTGTSQQTAWQLTLIPKDALLQKIIRSLVLSGDKDVQTLEIDEVVGNRTHIALSHITHPAQLLPEQEVDFERLSP